MKSLCTFLVLSVSILGCSAKPVASVSEKAERAISSVSSVNKILMITDSHGEGIFGKETVRLIEEAKGNISVYAVGGSSPSYWLNGQQGSWGYWEHHTHGKDFRTKKPLTPKIDGLLRSLNPDVVVVEMGTNLIWNPFTDKEKNEIEALVKKIVDAGKKCVWIGPPGLRVDVTYTQRINQVYEFLLNKMPKLNCDLHPTWKTIRYPGSGGDGIHYDSAGKEGKKRALQWVREATFFIDQTI